MQEISKTADFLGDIENQWKFTFPKVLKYVLNELGYNNKLSWINFKEEDIKEIEIEAQQFLSNTDHSLKNFKIFSGHKKLMLHISAQITEQTLNSSVEESTRSTTDDRPKKRPRRSPSSLANNNIQVSNQDVNLEEERKILTKKISNWIMKTTENIAENIVPSDSIKRKTDSIEIRIALSCNENYLCIGYIKCCLCSNTFKVQKIKSEQKWVPSNFYKHFKTHINSIQTTPQKVKKIRTAITDYFDKPNFVKPCSSLSSSTQAECSIPQPSDYTGEIINQCQSNSLLEVIDMNSSEENLRPSDEPRIEVIDQDFQIPGWMKEASPTPKKTKWTLERYSRKFRKQRQLERLSTKIKSGGRITDYFPIIVDQTLSIIETNNIGSELENTFNSISQLPTAQSCESIINILKETALKNSQKMTHQKRYTDPLKSFFTYIYIVGGKLVYETLYSNLKDSIPSLSTVKRTLQRNGSMEEGKFRFKELRDFLQKNNYSPTIWISEDQTKIIEKVEYDPTTNKIIGCVLKYDENGMPISDNYATSAKTIENLCNKERSSYAYAILAQPLTNNAPSFCLCIYGTNNKFNFNDVLRRWKYMKEIATEFGIKIAGFSADGDPRLMKSMRVVTNFPFHDENIPVELQTYFQMAFDLNLPICVQDTVHIGTKLRTKLLNPSTVIVLGNYIASKTHLQFLINQVTKDKHFLIDSFLSCEDKMNFEAADKISKECVMILLKQHIAGSEGTIAYLNIMRMVLDSFLSKTLTATERAYKIWFAVLFLRLWRYWIITSNDYTLKNNFITSNAYLCIELNAHAMVLAIHKFKQQNEESFFLPWLYSSQPCEKFFRAVRSMTSTFSTVVNFSLLDILKRTDRIQFLNDVVSQSEKHFVYPREQNRKLGLQFGQANNQVLPDLNEVSQVIHQAKEDAVKYAKSLGIELPDETWIVDILHINPIEPFGDIPRDHLNETLIEDDNDAGMEAGKEPPPSESTNEQASEQAIESNVPPDEIFQDLSILSILNPKFDVDLNIKDFSAEVKTSKRNNSYFINGPLVRVTVPGRKSIIIKKSTLLWLFSNNKQKVSSDRLMRYISDTKKNENVKKGNVLLPCVKANIGIGEWCIFKSNVGIQNKNSVVNIEKPSGSIEMDTNTISHYFKTVMVGQILSFSYLKGKKKEREYTLRDAPVKEGPKGVGVLCTFYRIAQDRILELIENQKLDFIEITNYLFSIPSPEMNINSGLQISREVLLFSKKFIDENILEIVKKLKQPRQSSESDSDASDISFTTNNSSDRCLDDIQENLQDSGSEQDSEKNQTSFLLDHYYAIYYSDAWYLGRIIEHLEGTQYKIKFLYKNLNEYIWPRRDDTQEVHQRYIFYGPLHLKGTMPFILQRSDELKIEKRYKEIKKIEKMSG